VYSKLTLYNIDFGMFVIFIFFCLLLYTNIDLKLRN